MIEPLARISAKNVESHPELPILAALETALDMTLLALSTWLPEITDPDYDHSRSPDLRAARHLCLRIELVRRAARHYRNTLAIYDDPEHPFAADQSPPHINDELDF